MTKDQKISLLAQIESALNHVRPHLKVDGGDIEVVDITEDYTVEIKWKGTCESCNMSAMTMKASIEETIKNKDCIILLFDHSHFRNNNIEKTINEQAPNCCIIDTRNFIDPSKLKKSILYRCLGKPLGPI